MFVVGIDENGLAPRLGPLIVTGTCFEISEEAYSSRKMQNLMNKRFKVTDSKSVMGYNRMSKAEGAVLAHIGVFLEKSPENFNRLIKELSFESLKNLRSLCPKDCSSQMCWEPDFSLPYWSEAEDINSESRKLKKLLDSRSFNIREVKSVIICTRRFNEMLSGSFRTKLDLVLYSFERLIIYFYEKYGPDVLYLCDRVGYIKKYLDSFRILKRFPLERKKESEKSVYDFKFLGKVEFSTGADKTHSPVALSSMIGKYIREVFIERSNQFFSSRLEDFEPVSGYNDKKTKEFISKNINQLNKLDIDESCFLRSR